jgi:hypothetical protein
MPDELVGHGDTNLTLLLAQRELKGTGLVIRSRFIERVRLDPDNLWQLI